VNRSLNQRIDLARVAEVPWSAERAERVSDRIVTRRRLRTFRARVLECSAVAFASAALLLGLLRVSAGLREAPEAAPAPARAAERVLYADGALGDGGYEASIQ